MNRFFTFILLFIVVLLGSVYFHQLYHRSSDLAMLSKREGQPEYTGQKMSAMMYDEQGRLQYVAQAQEIKRFDMIERTEFIQPQLEFFSLDTATKEWQLKADFAEIQRDNQLYLSGNVRLISLLPHSRLKTIETETLSIDLTTQDIASNSLVKTVGNGFVTTGEMLRGNLRKQSATLSQQVRTYLEPTLLRKQLSAQGQ